jgi:hypothetical protein
MVGMLRTTLRYKSRRPRQEALRTRLRAYRKRERSYHHYPRRRRLCRRRGTDSDSRAAIGNRYGDHNLQRTQN